MADIKHPHTNYINNIKDLYPMTTIIEDSKNNFIKENLSIHLHTSQIKLLKDAKKHSKPHHKKVRVVQYKKLQELNGTNGLFDLHKNLYIKKYEKLAKKGLVEVNTDVNDLPYDVIITSKGDEIINEIKELEAKWQDVVLEDIENKDELIEQLKLITHKASSINYNHKKQQKFVF